MRKQTARRGGHFGQNIRKMSGCSVQLNREDMPEIKIVEKPKEQKKGKKLNRANLKTDSTKSEKENVAGGEVKKPGNKKPESAGNKKPESAGNKKPESANSKIDAPNT